MTVSSNLVVSGGALVAGGGSAGSSGQILQSNGQGSAPTWITSSVLGGSSTNYIQNTSSLQNGATFYVSSGTVAGPLAVGGVFSATGTVTLGSALNAVTISSNVTLGGAGTLTNVPALGASQFVKTDANKNLTSGTLAATDMSALLAATNTWTAAQTFTSSVTVFD